jgi:RNA methyltransferase, TrmH family
MAERTPAPGGRGAPRPSGDRPATRADLQRLRRLSADRRARDDESAFVVEGPILVADAVAAGVELDAVFVEAGTELPAGLAPGVAVHTVVPGVLAKATDAVTSQGIAAVARRPDHAAGEIPPSVPVLVLAGIGDPGNAGTLLRSAEAAGFGAVLFAAGSADPWSPKCVRSSAGSVLRTMIVRGGEAVPLLDELAAGGRRRVGTRVADAVPFTEADLPSDVAIVLGSEPRGLPEELAPVIDEWVSIPMKGRTESLNVAMAGTLLCYEVLRRHG